MLTTNLTRGMSLAGNKMVFDLQIPNKLAVVWEHHAIGQQLSVMVHKCVTRDGGFIFWRCNIAEVLVLRYGVRIESD